METFRSLLTSANSFYLTGPNWRFPRQLFLVGNFTSKTTTFCSRTLKRYLQGPVKVLGTFLLSLKSQTRLSKLVLNIPIGPSWYSLVISRRQRGGIDRYNGLSTLSIRGQIASVLRFLTRTTLPDWVLTSECEVWKETQRNEIYSFTFYQVDSREISQNDIVYNSKSSKSFLCHK